MALPPGYGYQTVLGRYHEHALGSSQAEGVRAPQQGRNVQAMSPFDQLIGHQIASNLHVSPGIGAERYAQLVQQFRQVPSGLAQGGYVSQLIAQSDRIGREQPVGSAALSRFDGYLTQLVQTDPLLSEIELRPRTYAQQAQQTVVAPTSQQGVSIDQPARPPHR